MNSARYGCQECIIVYTSVDHGNYQKNTSILIIVRRDKRVGVRSLFNTHNSSKRSLSVSFDILQKYIRNSLLVNVEQLSGIRVNFECSIEILSGRKIHRRT